MLFAKSEHSNDILEGFSSSSKQMGYISLSSSNHTISVATMEWNGKHHAFVIEHYFKNTVSIVAR